MQGSAGNGRECPANGNYRVWNGLHIYDDFGRKLRSAGLLGGVGESSINLKFHQSDNVRGLDNRPSRAKIPPIPRESALRSCQGRRFPDL